jgi:hypothetical protein
MQIQIFSIAQMESHYEFSFLSIFVNVGIKSHGCIEQEKGIIVQCCQAVTEIFL